MPTEPKVTKNVFISHIHEDDDGLKKLKDLVKKNGMEMRDSSITVDKPNNAKSPDYIMNQILKPAIDWCSVLIVYISPGTKDSEWVNKEIEYAHETGKTIIGVWELGSNGCEIPEALDKYHHEIVGWNGTKIIDAINGNAVESEYPDGTPLKHRPITRYNC